MVIHIYISGYREQIWWISDVLAHQIEKIAHRKGMRC